MGERSYKNMVDYAKENLDDFSKVPFNEADSLVLTWLAYLHFHEDEEITTSDEGISILDTYRADYFDEMLKDMWNAKETLVLLTAVIANPRFRNMRLLYYSSQLDHQTGKQYASITFQLTEDLYYIAYRGTDWTVTGWKEDFKLSLTEPIPSQKLAVGYLNAVAALCPGKLIVGGYSKGGNLAVYAGAFCEKEVQDRIQIVYSHDGPGFSKEDLQWEGFSRISHKIAKTVPQFSVFGMLFEQECEGRIIKSHGSAIMQHNSMTWEIEGDHLVEGEKMSAAALAIHQRMNKWINTLDVEERRQFIDTLFEVIENTGESSFEDMGKNIRQNLPILLLSVRDMDPEMRKFMIHSLGLLVSGADPVSIGEEEIIEENTEE